jgi:hypothetical protein
VRVVEVRHDAVRPSEGLVEAHRARSIPTVTGFSNRTIRRRWPTR